MSTTRQQREARRIIPRHGKPLQVEIVGFRSASIANDLYHVLTRLPWWALFAIAVVAYVGVNALFAGLYLLGGDCINSPVPGRFTDAFFFSVQTLATIGYGVLAPTTLYAHAVVAAEALCGVLSFALITGIVFAKFSRPTAHVVFSDVACIGPHEGKRTLMFRMANERTRSRVVEAKVNVTFTREERTAEGVPMRRFYDLKLVRDSTPIFALSWTAMHVIDQASPLFGETLESLCDCSAEVVVSFSGLDEHLSQPTHGRHSYIADELRFDHRFVDVMSFNSHGRRVFDFRHFDKVVADAAAVTSAPLDAVASTPDVIPPAS